MMKWKSFLGRRLKMMEVDCLEYAMGLQRYFFSPDVAFSDIWKEEQTDNWLVWLLALSLLTSCGILGKWLNLSEPLLPRLQSRAGRLEKSAKWMVRRGWESAWVFLTGCATSQLSSLAPVPQLLFHFGSERVCPVPAWRSPWKSTADHWLIGKHLLTWRK